MDAQRWRLMQDIFEAALSHAPETRQTFVAEACDGDLALKLEVEALLANDLAAEGLLSSVVEGAARSLPSGSDVGLRIGPYQVMREIGSGGMGVVYLAVRSDDHYQHRVAVKLIRRDIDSGPIVRRFRQERQILANLTHPNIAAILDGGSTVDGRPYIVMEFIEGEPINRHCRNAGLDLESRIELFRIVCAAVHHAHQNLVIHRDIKPGNILVTPTGSPKLIDFGVAKLLLPDATSERSLQTETAHRLLTPDYASPEQVRGEELSTTSDIYSLGVTLYELLTGRRPFQLDGLTPGETERIICLEDPVKPSEAEDLPPRLRTQLRGDLDNIVLKAIAKEPRRRYNSADQLADDLLRYLKGDAVIARSDTFRYRTSKLIRRYRMAVVTITLVVLSLAAGLVSTRSKARLAQRRFEQVRSLAGAVIFDMSESIRDLPGNTEARAALVKNALPYLDDLAKDSESDPALLWELGRAYTKIGDLQGAPSKPNLGHPGDALASYRKALRVLEAINPKLRQDRHTEALVEVYEDAGLLETHRGDMASAVVDYSKALALARDYYGRNPADEKRQQLLASSYKQYGDAQLRQRDSAGALRSFRAGLAAFGNAMPREDLTRRALAAIYARIGDALLETGPVPEAIANFQKDIAIREELVRTRPTSLQFRRDLFVGYITIGNALGGARTINIGDLQSSAHYYREAFSIAQDLARHDPRNSQASSDLGFAYLKMGEATRFSDPRGSVEWHRKALAVTDQLLQSDPDSVETRRWNAERHEGLADALDRTGDHRAALAELQHAAEIWRALSRADPLRLDLQHSELAAQCKVCDLRTRIGDTRGALRQRDDALSLMERTGVNRGSLYVLREFANCYEAWARLEHQLARTPGVTGEQKREHWARARDWYRKSLDVWNEWAARGIGDPPSAVRKSTAAAELANLETSLQNSK